VIAVDVVGNQIPPAFPENGGNMQTAASNTGPLAGIKVVEMGIWVAGPATSAVLGDWGAEVIKIENPAGGDPVRGLMALGFPIDLPVNPRWANVFVRAQNAVELIALLDAHFASRPLAEWAERFDRAELVWGPVQTISGVVADPQAAALEAFAPIAHRSGDTVRLVRSPIEFSATPAAIRHGGPELGEHTEEVLLEKGYTWEDIASLKEKGAIG
jgi:crotonobetainyl-CoA:carnitine CoA-transferase CaiB-like acyl-CoA transferase